MTLGEFADWATAQGSVAKFNDGQYIGECVSLINQLCWRVLNIPADSWGHAKDWGRNSIQREYFDVPPPGTPLRPLDILVYGEDFGGGLGHIEIVLDDKTAIYQNRNLNGRVRTGSLLPGYYAVLRKKGNLEGGEMVTRELLDKLWAGYFDRPPMKTEYEQFVGRPVDVVIDTAWNSPEFKTRMDGLRKVVQSKAGTVSKQDIIDYLSRNLK